MDFKSEREQREFFGAEFDGRVRAIATELDLWSIYNFKKSMLVTGVLRTPEEQAAIYPGNPTKPSPHLDRPCRAVDFRRIQFTAEELNHLVVYFSQNWGKWHYRETGNPLAIMLIDDRGATTPHLHIAVYDI